MNNNIEPIFKLCQIKRKFARFLRLVWHKQITVGVVVVVVFGEFSQKETRNFFLFSGENISLMKNDNNREV